MYDEDLEGFEYIRFSGSISTCDMDLEFDIPERPFPFGFQLPQPPPIEIEVPELSSSAWAAWLG